MNIQNTLVSKHTLNFKAHLPNKFDEVACYLGKCLGNPPAMRVSAELQDGLLVTGTVVFKGGGRIGLVLDEGFEGLEEIFKQQALKDYNKKIAPEKVRSKLNYSV